MVINATVNQVDVQNLRLGQKARIHFDAYPGLELPAHVDSIAAVTKPGMFRAQFVKEVAVRLKLDAMDNRVIPDLSVSAEIMEDSDTAALAVAPMGPSSTTTNLTSSFRPAPAGSAAMSNSA